MNKRSKTTLGVMAAFFLLLKLPNVFNEKSDYEYGEQNYLNISENVDEESNYSSQEDEIEEERRLFYVAMTRAKRQLTISYTKEKNGKAVKPSRFVGELFRK